MCCNLVIRCEVRASPSGEVRVGTGMGLLAESGWFEAVGVGVLGCAGDAGDAPLASGSWLLLFMGVVVVGTDTCI